MTFLYGQPGERIRFASYGCLYSVSPFLRGSCHRSPTLRSYTFANYPMQLYFSASSPHCLMKPLFLFLCMLFLANYSCTAQEEPFGKVKVKTGRGKVILNYDFPLSYYDTVCKAGAFEVPGTTPFEDNDDLGYQAPRIAEYRNVFLCLLRNLYYPEFAKENNIQGRVTLFLAISKEGKIEKLTIKHGVHVSLDKEAARVLRLIKIEKPALINGTPTDVCLTMPVVFRLD